MGKRFTAQCVPVRPWKDARPSVVQMGIGWAGQPAGRCLTTRGKRVDSAVWRPSPERASD
ncbi:hypothetical protein [Haladaptatus litoreus]|uniref:hypothetical protein n=1 Tax=Haladaptatus litoreus TaxID=553468 RepID=UPI0011154C19|nr:hypothetical protein [Haladaptatus litoreus]